MNMISANTSLVGVLGDPIKHSLSPTIHNAALREMNLNWCYLAIPCNSQNLELVLSALGKINCQGLNITIPHKSNSIKHCLEISTLGKEIGAINTLIPNGEGGWLGDNTDVEGFIQPLKYEKNWQRKKALLIGSGGSARAVIAGLKRLKIKDVSVITRNQDSLNKFLDSVENQKLELNIKSSLSESNQVKEMIKQSDLIINTTPVGMYNKEKYSDDNYQIPLGSKIWENLKSGTILYDLIYNPRPTKWLKLGMQKNCKTIDGLEMLIQQGAASLRLWSGINAIPVEIMREAAENYLN